MALIDVAPVRRRVRADADWQRLPGFRHVTAADWNDARWQRTHAVRSVAQLKQVFGDALDDELADSMLQDQRRFASMAMLIPPHQLNTMDETDLRSDPTRRYMAPAAFERHPLWPSHPLAKRDPLDEKSMWAVEGLTHRYPTKVLLELVTTCPQYCGHCTRMDLVGGDTAQVAKGHLNLRREQRFEAIIDYLRRTPSVRDVVVSGGDIANVPIDLLVTLVTRLLELDNIRDIRLATKALVAMPQHFLQPHVQDGLARLAATARARGVSLAVHTHANHGNQITREVGEVVRHLLAAGMRDVRNQGVLLRGVNDSREALLDLCGALLDTASITPYYFYLCDMIPNAEHWRTSLDTAMRLQKGLMGMLPGFATPRLVCDVPQAGKMWVHQVDEYDRERGISYWTKAYRTSVETEFEAAARRYTFYDPIDTLPESGQAWWRGGG